LGRRHPSWDETVRERIAFVAPDDDENYNILAMLLLEEHGIGFSKQNLRDLWLKHLPITMTFGPERTLLLKAGIDTLASQDDADLDRWVQVLNPRDEFCGAVIRADVYGYACPGWPAMAAELAWRDASWTHRRTGIYGTMFVAAAIACAQVMTDRLGIFETALQFVPQRSRFYRIVSDCLQIVRTAQNWLEAYDRIYASYRQHDHCRIYMECGTLINTLYFAQDIADGICIQVSQGNDTDSFGATAGSLLGTYFGPGGFDMRWLAPFNDDIHTGLAWFFDRSLSSVARRMSLLPLRTAAPLVSAPDALPGARRP
jgi:ADP-ribosylglycohydrolase